MMSEGGDIYLEFDVRKNKARKERRENARTRSSARALRTGRAALHYVSACVYEDGGCERRLRLRPEWCYACIEQREQAEGTAAIRLKETKRLIRRVEAHMLSDRRLGAML